MENAESASSYRVWGRDKVLYEAVDLSGLVQWIKDQKVTGDHWIYSEPDDRWRKAADFPELQAMFRSQPQGGPPGTAVAGSRGRGLGLKPEALRRMKGFADMNDGQIESFFRYMEVLHCQQFSHIVRRGEHGDAMYLVLEGELRALAMVDGKESTLGTITAGESFGEISLIDQGPRSLDVVANKDSVLLKISSAAFEQLLREAPALAVTFLLALSRSVVGRVRSLTKRYEDSVRFIRAAQLAR
jgi:cyclic nucleotide-binding protein